MKGEIYFEEISAGAVSPQMPPCVAVIVNVGSQKEITACLKELYTTSTSKVYIVTVASSKLKQVLDRCAEAGIPAIVNCGEELPAVQTWHPQCEYSAMLVSPGSSNAVTEMISDKHLQSFANIGYQGYRYDPDILQDLQNRYFEEMRLGVLRSNITLCEPLIRDAQYAFIDMRSVRYSDYPCSGSANPNGLYAEELCTVARYTGLAQNLKAVFIYGETDGEKQITICNKLIAETIWHLCEGIACNLKENPANEDIDEHFLRKIVSMGENGENISFITSCTTQRWWMEIPAKEDKNIFVPCSYTDYQTACTGEVPLRWLFFYQKYTLQ